MPHLHEDKIKFLKGALLSSILGIGVILLSSAVAILLREALNMVIFILSFLIPLVIAAFITYRVTASYAGKEPARVHGIIWGWIIAGSLIFILLFIFLLDEFKYYLF